MGISMTLLKKKFFLTSRLKTTVLKQYLSDYFKEKDICVFSFLVKPHPNSLILIYIGLYPTKLGYFSSADVEKKKLSQSNDTDLSVYTD